MNVIGFESSAHTLGIGVFSQGEIKSNARLMYKPKNEGIIPRKAADHHSEHYGEVLARALKESGLKLGDFDCFAYTLGPGLGPCLQIGAVAAKTLAQKYEKPLVGVNHCVAHIEITRFATGMKDPVVVYVSGGNTQILVLDGKKYRVLGETLDIGLGNLIDSFGRAMGLEFAHGSVIEKMAAEGKYIGMPYTIKGMDFALTGLLTDAEKKLKTNKKEDVCHSLQETAFSMLVEATERAMALSKKNEVVVCGGVAQNRKLQSMLNTMAEERGGKFAVAAGEYNADNGAMIAYTGYLMAKAGQTIKPECWGVKQRFRTDEVEIDW